MNEAHRHTIKRRLDEPRLELGDTIMLKNSETAVVLARYIPSGVRDEVCYILEVISDGQTKLIGVKRD